VDYTLLDDSELMQRVAERQTAALGELYDRFGRLVYSMAYHVLTEGSLAEEVTLRVWEKAELYQAGQGRVATWLSSLARNRAIDVYRSLKARPEGNLAGFAVEDAIHVPSDHNVEAAVEGREGQEVMRRALATLPAEQRTALAYAFFMGYSHGEIAQALGQPLGTVKTRIRLAMRKLRDVLGEELSLGQMAEDHSPRLSPDGRAGNTAAGRQELEDSSPDGEMDADDIHKRKSKRAI
jgi:RNA polymerase sigma-70 factor (ECF subfamily)